MIYSLTKFYLGFTCGKKNLKGTLHYYQVFTFAVVCVAEQIINNLYFFHYLFRGRIFFKGLGSSHSKYKDRMGKINNSFKIPKNKPNIIISHS